MKRKPVSAIEAYAAAVKLANKKAKAAPVIINGCPDCGGTGKINGKVCGTCGGERD